MLGLPSVSGMERSGPRRVRVATAAASSVESEPMPTNVQPSARRAAAAAPSATSSPQALPCRSAARRTRSSASTVDRRGELAGHAEVVAEVAGADEQHVDPVDGGDLRRPASTAARRLDLDHAEDLVARAVQGARVEPEPAGPVVGGHAPVPGGRVAQVPDRFGDLGRRVEAGQHDPGGAAGPGRGRCGSGRRTRPVRRSGRRRPPRPGPRRGPAPRRRRRARGRAAASRLRRRRTPRR